MVFQKQQMTNEERRQRYQDLRSYGWNPGKARIIRDYFPWNYRRYLTDPRNVCSLLGGEQNGEAT